MENEVATMQNLLADGIGLLAVVLTLMAPLGLALAAMGSGRFRNRYSNLHWMIVLFPFGFIVAYLFGWMFSFAFSTGPGFTGGFQSAWHAVPWGTDLGPGFRRENGNAAQAGNLAFVRFVAVGWIGSIILAGAVLERIKLGGLLLLSTLLTGFCIALFVAWGWSENGWMVALMGFHDPVGITGIGTVTGGFALGVLKVLGPRLASIDDKGNAQTIEPHSPGIALTGYLLFFLGLIGLSVATLDIASPVQLGETTAIISTNIYGAPTDPGGVLLNILAATAGGLLIGTILARAELSKTAPLMLAGVVGTLPSADFFNPLQTLILSMFLVWACGTARSWLEGKFNLDDVTGSVALFGFAGFWGLVISGFLLWGMPTSVNPDYVRINPFGHAGAAMILFWIIGFIPGYLAAHLVKYAGGLRLEQITELVGRDLQMLREAEESHNAAYRREEQYVTDQIEKRT